VTERRYAPLILGETIFERCDRMLAEAGLRRFPRELTRHEWQMSPDVHIILEEQVREWGGTVEDGLQQQLFGYPLVEDPELPPDTVLLRERKDAA
jgi:hypothetical protein